MHKRVFQKNNLVVFQVRDFPQLYSVETPNGVVLEEFRYAYDAREFCARTFDWCRLKDIINDIK